MTYLREDERRLQTTDAAIRLISREGLGAATLRNIAAEAGVPLSSLHHVYPDKDSLLADAFRRSAQLVMAVVDQIDIDPAADLESAIATLIMTYVRSILADSPAQRSQYELFLWALRSPAQETETLRDVDVFVEAFERFLSPHAYGREVDLRFLCEIVSAQIDGAILQALAGHPMDQLERRQRQLAAGLVAASSTAEP